MTPETAIDGATTQTLAGMTQPVAAIVPAQRQRVLPSRRMVAVMILPDGKELFMRETTTGWTMIEYGTARTSAVSRSDLAVFGDIAAAAAKRPSLTLVSSR